MVVFWAVVPCSILTVCQYFTGTKCLHLQPSETLAHSKNATWKNKKLRRLPSIWHMHFFRNTCSSSYYTNIVHLVKMEWDTILKQRHWHNLPSNYNYSGQDPPQLEPISFFVSTASCYNHTGNIQHKRMCCTKCGLVHTTKIPNQPSISNGTSVIT
jgi:general stress protein 26